MRANRDRDYTAYVEEHVLRLRRIGFRLCGDWQEAADLVQEALTRLYVHWGRASQAQSLNAYVRQILVRTYLEQVRRPWYRRIFPTATPPDRPAVGSASPDHRMDLMAAIAQIPAGQRTVIVLRYFEGLDVKETAEILNCTPGTVKSQTSAALKKLRNLLPGYLEAVPHPIS